MTAIYILLVLIVGLIISLVISIIQCRMYREYCRVLAIRGFISFMKSEGHLAGGNRDNQRQHKVDSSNSKEG